ncbi:YhbY family RNA-binding protein [Puniceicoccaceae bacterium K14]|nr:YhbY family RNA-binding protein [Puniceicoccaceae bacterium K14]
MFELSSKDKAILRNAAQRLKPSVHVGKSGLSEGVVRELEIAFKDDELIKVAFKAERDEMKELVEKVETSVNCICVGGVGKRRSFYRKMKVEEES